MEVAVLLPEGARRVRLGAALQRAGYRVVMPRQPAAWAAGRRPPVLVTDATEGAARVRADVVAAAPGTACVVLVHEPTPTRYRQLLAAGATVLPASADDEDVVAAVAAASRALICLPATVARALAGAEGDRPVLSARESGWLRALVHGATVAGLARTAGYSEREMYRLLGSLYSRLGAENRTEALLRADRWGLLNPPTGSVTASSRIPRQRGPWRD